MKVHAPHEENLHKCDSCIAFVELYITVALFQWPDLQRSDSMDVKPRPNEHKIFVRVTEGQAALLLWRVESGGKRLNNRQRHLADIVSAVKTT